MKILFVGSRNLKYRGARYYHPGAKLYHGLVRNGHNVFWMSDRDEARNGGFLGTKYFGKKHCEDYFLETCRNFLPEMIIFYFADLISTDAIAEARALLGPQVKTAQFNVDPIFRPHNIKMLKNKLPVMDASFITTAGPGLKKFSHQNGFVSFVPNAVDSSIEWPKAHEKSDQAFDVFWAARLAKTYEGDPRYVFPQFLYSQESITMNYLGTKNAPILYDAHYYHALDNAKMGLNISVTRDVGITEDAPPEELYLYSSDRIAHYMGSGLLTFITRGFALEEMFVEDKEAVYFETKEELLDKVLYYKKHDSKRRAIAQAGWIKSHNEYNERLIASYIVDATMGQPFSQNYAWPTEKY